MMYVNIVYKIFYWSLLWLNTTKMRLKKLLITTGKMPVVRRVKMNTSGVWLLNRFPRVANALASLVLLLKSLLHLHLKSLQKALQSRSKILTSDAEENM